MSFVSPLVQRNHRRPWTVYFKMYAFHGPINDTSADANSACYR